MSGGQRVVAQPRRRRQVLSRMEPHRPCPVDPLPYPHVVGTKARVAELLHQSRQVEVPLRLFTSITATGISDGQFTKEENDSIWLTARNDSNQFAGASWLNYATELTVAVMIRQQFCALVLKFSNLYAVIFYYNIWSVVLLQKPIRDGTRLSFKSIFVSSL